MKPGSISFDPGIYFDLPEEQYHAARALSCSGMKQLAVSPLQYWHHNLNPNAEPSEETAAQRFGKAAHCLGIEPQRFPLRYAMKLSLDDFPGALVTVDDLKAFCGKHGLLKGGKKQDLIKRIRESGTDAVIWDEELKRHAELNAGKTLLDDNEAALVKRAAGVLAADPYVKDILSGGMAEVSFFVRDPETGVLLKARMDYVKPAATIDLKTFANSRGKPIDRVVNDAIYYEGYNLQCAHYHHVRELVRQQLASGEIRTHGNVPESWIKGFIENDRHGFGFVFIESDEPFDLRIVEMKQSEAPGAGANVYWSAAAMKMADLTQLYAECLRKCGDRPWREPTPPRVLLDTDIPQLMFA